MARNKLGVEGAKFITEALRVNASLTQVLAFCHAPSLAPHLTLLSSHSLSGGLFIHAQVNLSMNALCGIDIYGKGTYTSDGIKAIADALRVSASLTQVLAFCPLASRLA